MILRVSGSGVVGMAHLDGSGTEECAINFVQRVQELSLGYVDGRIELQLIGGYSDPRNYAESLFYSIMRKFLIWRRKLCGFRIFCQKVIHTGV
jgi:protein N-terminal asparagine amidohydrolase